nr:TPM domain-containing protein [Sphingobacterium detergens]
MMALNAEEQERVVHAINVAENETSGEIRVVIENHCPDEVHDRATYYFSKLGMHKTMLKNGVLIYIALEDHKFSIIGDRGINQRVESDFWNCTKDLMVEEFRTDKIVEGLVKGIEHAGKQLAKFFPREHDDINELPNDIVFGDR